MENKLIQFDSVPDNGSGIENNREGLLSRVVTRQYKLILFTSVAFLALAGAYAFLSPEKHQVKSRIYVERNSPRLMAEQSDIMSGSRNYLSAQAELIKSMPIISEMLSNPDIAVSLQQAGVTDPVYFLREKIDVNVGLKDDLISISGIDRNPIWMSNIINSMVDTYISYNNRLNNNTSKEVLELLQREKLKSHNELETKQKKLVELARSSGVLSSGREGDNIELVKLAKMAEVLTEAELELNSIQTLYDTVNSLVGQPDQIKAIATANGEYASYITEENSLRLRLQALEMKLKKFEQQATGQHPSVHATLEEIASVRRQIADNTARLAKDYLDSIIQKWVICSRNVNEQKKRFDEQKSVAWALNSKETEYTLLKNDIKRLEDICATLDRRIKEESVSAGAESMKVTILERADILSSELATNRTRLSAMGLIAGLWLGLVLGFMRELSDKNVRSIDDVNEATSMPLLGVVPSMDSNGSIRKHGLTAQLGASSKAAEAFREVWSSLYYQGLVSGHKVIMVTSPQAGDGKSVISSNLAITIAHSGARVLLIDADLRRPSQAKIHDSHFWRKHGLSTVLEYGLDSLADCIETTSITGLDLLSSGPAESLHCDLLAGKVFRDMLEVLKTKYDRIIIDAPPVLDIADSRIMASASDDTLLVVRADKSGRSQCAMATAILSSVGADIAGVVINDAVQKKNKYGYSNSKYSYISSAR